MNGFDEVLVMNKEHIASELRKNILCVYWYLLWASKNFVGLREGQRKLNLRQ
jgi:hypothetical protein